MPAPPRISLLGYVLLGLLRQAPHSGYDLRKLFGSTPLMSFSDSPGAIYPALRKLEEQGLVQGEVQGGAGLRVRRVFRITAAGTSALRAWLTRPVTRTDVVRRIDELIVRFGFLDAGAGPLATVRLLQGLRRELKGYVPGLRSFLHEQGHSMPRSGRLALEWGVREYEALLRWTSVALAAYGRAEGDT
jgi:DNA-binding PadR family transcriptional regulator